VSRKEKFKDRPKRRKVKPKGQPPPPPLSDKITQKAPHNFKKKRKPRNSTKPDNPSKPRKGSLSKNKPREKPKDLPPDNPDPPISDEDEEFFSSNQDFAAFLQDMKADNLEPLPKPKKRKKKSKKSKH